ncbi:MAG: phosphate acyltransferase, partial [Selenomonadaceae bacterium]|nr:phosphate acyltransferase [Selenomonadaceae bacterium]
LTIFKLIKEEISSSGIIVKLGAFLLKPALKRLAKRLDVAEYGGAPLLGVDGYCIISHGSSDAKSICSAIGMAQEYVKSNILDKIKTAI